MMLPRLGLLFPALVFLCLPCISVHAIFNACANTTTVAKGDPFTIGLVFIPGGDAKNVTDALKIINAAADSNTMSLCNPDVIAALKTNYSAKVAIFNAKVDRLQVLRIPYADVIFNLVNTTSMNLPPIMTVVAFRNSINTPPAYIASAATNYTNGAGFVVSLALLMRFDRGNLQYMQWFGMNCDSCGGVKSTQCIHQLADNGYNCATPIVNCTCEGNTATNSDGSTSSNGTCLYTEDRFRTCSTAINVAWSGTDRNSFTFQTGSQLQRVNTFSLVSLFYIAKNKVEDVYNTVQTNIKESWSAVQGDVQQQLPDFSGSLGTTG